ncbi:outer membrane lipoprotein carrier protein LolA [Olivibacter sp. CPCC 100613]|uniref:LolA family protein n=1 Tax=Olivibacter sp. CPCC 100613 TaxID=3079931 RepID=UPI002FFC3287
MKKIFSLIIFIAYGLAALGQSDPTTKKLLSDISKKYQSYRTAKINFGLKAVNQQNQTTINEKGELTIEPRTSKYRILLENQVMISDGKQQWNVLKDEQEVQINHVEEAQSGSITPATIFSFYNQGFKYPAAKSEQVAGKSLSVIDLTPTDNNKSYFKVRLRLDKSLNQIYDVTVFDKSGSLYTYTIQNFTPNVKVTPKTFIFDKADYPGMELVDLR